MLTVCVCVSFSSHVYGCFPLRFMAPFHLEESDEKTVVKGEEMKNQGGRNDGQIWATCFLWTTFGIEVS